MLPLLYFNIINRNTERKLSLLLKKQCMILITMITYIVIFKNKK